MEKVKLETQMRRLLFKIAENEIWIPSKNLDTSELWTSYELCKRIYLGNVLKIIPLTLYGLMRKSEGIIRYVGSTKLPLKKRLQSHFERGRNPRKCYWLNRYRSEIEIFPIKDGIELDMEAHFYEMKEVSRLYRNGDYVLNDLNEHYLNFKGTKVRSIQAQLYGKPYWIFPPDLHKKVIQRKTFKDEAKVGEYWDLKDSIKDLKAEYCVSEECTKPIVLDAINILEETANSFWTNKK